ncbi:MAG: flippase [Candidatus Ranarchaeia archaeon]
MSSSLKDVIESSTRGGFFLVSGSILANLILAIGLIVIPRLLGSDQYGLYTLSFILPSLLALFADFGVNAGLIRFSASLRAKGENKKAADIIKHGFLFKAAVSLILFAVSFTFADDFATYFLSRPNAGVYIKLASFALPFQVISTTVNSAFIGLDQMSTVAFITNLQAAIKVLVSVGLVWFAFGVFGAITGHVTSYVITGILGAIVLLLVYRKKLCDNNEDNVHIKDSLKTLILYGFPLYVSTLLGGFSPQYQGIILALFASNAEIGNFKAATNLLTVVTMITMPIATTLFPAFSKLDPEGEDIKKFFLLSVKYTTLLIVPVTFLLILFSRQIVFIAYGSSYASAPLFLTIYCTTYFLVGLGSLVLSSFFNGTGNTWITFKMVLITLLINIPLTTLLTSLYGVIGLIVTNLASNFCGTLYGISVAKSKFKIKMFPKKLLKLYAISAVAVIPVVIFLIISNMWWLWNVILGVAMYIVIWLTLMPFTETLQKSEFQNIEIMLEKIPFLNKMLKPIILYEEKLFNKTKSLNANTR